MHNFFKVLTYISIFLQHEIWIISEKNSCYQCSSAYQIPYCCIKILSCLLLYIFYFLMIIIPKSLSSKLIFKIPIIRKKYPIIHFRQSLTLQVSNMLENYYNPLPPSLLRQQYYWLARDKYFPLVNWVQ